MNRRQFLLTTTAATLAANEIPYRPYSACLPNYLTSLAQAANARRIQALNQLTTPAAIEKRSHWARETFWNFIGGPLEKTPLNTRTLSTIARPGYKIEKIVYESRPGYLVSANLYVPTTGKPPYPAVLFQMGHSPNGKANKGYHTCCLALTQLGFVVLGFDPMGQGERAYYPGIGSPDDEHTQPAFPLMLIGDTATRWQVWDSVRSLDVLAAHPLVDPKRLASTGQSGGGTTTMFLACADPRLATAVVGSGNSENFFCPGFIPPGSTDDAEQNLINSAPAAFDRWDLLHAFAPKPLLVMASAHDFFGTYSPNYLANGRQEFATLKRLYTKLGHPAAIDWYETPLPHALAYDYRVQIYNWMGRHLLPGFQPLTDEPAVTLEPEKDLLVTPTGSLVKDLNSTTPFRIFSTAPIQPRPRPLAEILKADRPAPAVAARTLGRANFAHSRIEALEIPTAPQVWCPAWLFQPRTDPKSKTPVLIAVSLDGRGHWREGGLWDTLATQGYTICSVDIRGIGDLRPDFGKGNPGYESAHQDENHYAWASYILGKPLVGQRVTDLLAIAAALRNRPDFAGRPIALAARGPMAVPALFTAALDEHIASVHLTGLLQSFRSILETERYAGGRYERNDRAANNATNVAPGLLQSTDIPEILAKLGQKATVNGTVDATGAPGAQPWTAPTLATWLDSR